MDVPEELQQWLARMQTIQQELSTLLADESLPAEVREHLGTVQDHTHRFIHIVQDIAAQLPQLPPDSSLDEVSHELRSPLTVVVGYLRMIATDMFGELSDSQQQIVVNIEANANFINQDIGRIFD